MDEVEPEAGPPGFDLPVIRPKFVDPARPFTNAGDPIDTTALDFWSWAYSDVVDNTSRGVIAEYLVARAIGADAEPRLPWATYDLMSPDGITIEVKSAAFIQSWRQAEYSKITFGYGKARAWDPELSGFVGEPMRHAQVYVFALLKHRDQPTLDPLDVTQWEFYVVPTRWLNERKRSQHSIGLKALRYSEFGTPVDFAGLASKIGEVAE